MYFKYTGVILKKHPLGEADELLTIYTKEAGKIRVKARGVRKIQSRLGGNLETLNEIEFEVAYGSRNGRGSSLPVVISSRAKTLNNFLRENLKKFAYALVGIETLYRLSADSEENVEAYNLLLNFLKDLGSLSGENLSVRKFQLGLLGAMGYQPPPLFDRESDKEIHSFLNQILEREVKSKSFLSHVESSLIE